MNPYQPPRRMTTEEALRQREAASKLKSAARRATDGASSGSTQAVQDHGVVKYPRLNATQVGPRPNAPNDSEIKAAPDVSGNETAFSQTGDTQDIYATVPAPTSTNLPSTSLADVEPLALAHPQWGLPRSVWTMFVTKGIKNMYDWQAQSLQLEGVLQGAKNLVYTAPTSGGKSLVADVLVIKRVLEQKKKAIIVLPFIAIVQEKTKFLREILKATLIAVEGSYHGEKVSFRKAVVVGFHSGSRNRIGWKDLDIAVCTTEKANALVNTAIEEKTIDQLGIVVFDELHTISEGSRGYILELLATKLLCMPEYKIQLVGMSATLSNVDVLAKWLQGYCYEGNFRPIALEERVVVENCVFNYNEEQVGKIPQSGSKDLRDPQTNAVVTLAKETVKGNFGALIFCESRNRTEVMSRIIVNNVPQPSPEVLEMRMDVVRSLAQSPTGLDPNLEAVIPGGIAFHHAGLTTEERDIVADAYDKGIIKAICCTPTMAAGVNLPARRVIINPHVGRDFAEIATIRQMRGRAGRTGWDTVGETYICCTKAELPKVMQLATAELPAIASCLAKDTPSQLLPRALLEIIATQLANTESSIEEYFNHTLLTYTHTAPSALPSFLQSALSYLTTNNFILLSDDSTSYTATPLGHATVTAGMAPEEGLFLHSELSKALGSFNLETDLHIVYQFTPTHITKSTKMDIDYKYMRTLTEQMPYADLRTVDFIGLSLAAINRFANGAFPPKDSLAERMYHRFYVALMLRQIINEVPLNTVAENFAAARGFVQQLASVARGFASTSASFCRVMNWTGLAVLLEHYAWRLEVGVRDDLVELSKLPFVKSFTARVFWESGLRSVQAVAHAEVDTVAECLKRARPRKMRREGEEELMKREMERALIVKSKAERMWRAETAVDELEF